LKHIGSPESIAFLAISPQLRLDACWLISQNFADSFELFEAGSIMIRLVAVVRSLVQYPRIIKNYGGVNIPQK
jgi:hypothetical protein